jgi:hypothetical protein
LTDCMADEPLVEEVRGWLQRHGYVLEMEVARAVSTHASWVWQGNYYTDPVTKKLREVDVWAVWPEPPRKEEQIPHALSVFFECKSTTAPWILFAASSESRYSLPLVYFDDGCEKCEAMELGMSNRLKTWGRETYAITQKRDVNKGADHAHESVYQAVNSAVGMTGGGTTVDGHHDMNFTSLAVPAVVTRSPLVICSLNESGEVDLQVTDRATIDVGVPSETGYENYSVFVMSVSALDDFLQNMTAVMDEVASTEVIDKSK